jgi:hypothetical protein
MFLQFLPLDAIYSRTSDHENSRAPSLSQEETVFSKELSLKTYLFWNLNLKATVKLIMIFYDTKFWEDTWKKYFLKMTVSLRIFF